MLKFNILPTSIELLCIFFITVLLSLYLYYLHCFNYWKKRGVPTLNPCFPTGDITKAILGKEHLFTTIASLYRQFKNRGHKHGGVYFANGPVYFPIDPSILKSIFTTDFVYFMDRGMAFDEKSFPLSAHLFFATGSKWKNLRSKLSPSFSSGKLKAAYEIFLKTAELLVKAAEPMAERGDDVNINSIASNFTTDLIFATTLALEVNSLKNPENEVSKIVFQALHPSIWTSVKMIMMDGIHNPGNLFKVMFVNKTVGRFFINLIKDIIKLRQKTNANCNDFLSLILKLQDKGELSFNEVVAQCYLFFLAGVETSAQTISFSIHALAHYPEIQNKVRKEIFETIGKDYQKYSYEDILKLPYLDKVFKETLRLHPVLGAFNRVCVKPYTVPGTDVKIEEGTPVVISALGLHRDPEYFPDPLNFDPERFDENQSIVPFTFLPFGEGPRHCIGMRYGTLQTKLGIATLVSQFKFLPSAQTPKHVEYDPLSTTPILTPKKGIWVKIEKLGMS